MGYLIGLPIAVSAVGKKERSGAFRRKWLFIAFCFIILVSASATPVLAATLDRLRMGVHGTPYGYTRLVFELSGDEPLTIDPFPQELVIRFRELVSKLSYTEKSLPKSAPLIASVKILTTPPDSRIVISFREKNCKAAYSYLPAERPAQDAYRLVVDILPPHVSGPPDSRSTVVQAVAIPEPKEPAAEAGSREQPSQDTAQTEFAGKRDISPLEKAGKALDNGKYQEAYELFEAYLNPPPTDKGELAAALYGLADSYFFLHQGEPATSSVAAIGHYQRALKADPSAPQAPWAYYRCGLLYEAVGDTRKATESFEQVLTRYPQHPTVPRCWLALGRKYQKQRSYPEAIRAFRSSLESATEKPLRAWILWHLGESLYLAGEDTEAAKTMRQCLEEDPSFHLKEPLILKYLGEELFLEKEYEKARDTLLLYFNLKPDNEDNDLVLARLAEILSLQEEQGLTGKLHAYIQSNYPNSEGEVICKIRRAEQLEQKGNGDQQEVLAIYEDLDQKQLPPPLARLVRFKLAAWHCNHQNYEKSLALIDDYLKNHDGKVPEDDFQLLRKKVVESWTRQAFAAKEHSRVIQLYEANPGLFSNPDSQDLEIMVAESFSASGMHGNELAIYERMLGREKGGNREELLIKAAQCSFKLGDMEKSVQYCTQVQSAPLQEEKALLLGRIYFAQHQYAKVIDTFKSIQGKGQLSTKLEGEWSTIYGESLIRTGDCEKALPWLEKNLEALKQNDSGSDTLVRLYIAQSKCLRKLKKEDKAIAALEEAARVNTSESLRDQLAYDLSKLYLEMGEVQKATEKLTSLLKSSQSFWQTAAKQQLDYIAMESQKK